MRFFITLAYNGRNYVGWQVQPNGKSIQSEIQNALSMIFRQEIQLVGAGRTDAGVHASKMVAHFDIDDLIYAEDEVVRKLNSILTKDIAIYKIQRVTEDAHARFSATSRTYKYFISNHKNPFLYEFRYNLNYKLDIEKMNQIAAILKEYQDFTSFSKLHTDVKTNNCNIEFAQWIEDENGYVFTIKADRFLRNMVRAIVGTLLEVGRGKLDEVGFRRIIEAKDRSAAGDSVPSHALFLYEVSYPDSIWV